MSGDPITTTAALAGDGRLDLTVGSDVPACLLAANRALLSGDAREAARCLDEQAMRAVELWSACHPDRVDGPFLAAKLCQDLGRVREAETWWRRVLARRPLPEAMDQLARLLMGQPTRWSEASTWSRRAHEAVPGRLDWHQNHAWNLLCTGRLDEGIAAFWEAARRHADSADAWSAALWCEHYRVDRTRAQINAGYRQWGRRFFGPHLADTRHGNRPDPQRRLRIGYLSPDFRRSPISYVLEILLDGHDRRQVEIFGYGSVRQPDATTARLAGRCDHYRDIVAFDADEAAECVRADGIDVLIAVGGVLAGHRFDVLARRPAPVQVDYGGLSSSGLTQVTARFSDALIDPPESHGDYVEPTWTLPGGMACFRPPAVSPAVVPPPCTRNRPVVFGSCNQVYKISPTTLRLWAAVRRAVPGSRLLLKFPGAADPGVQQRFGQAFEAAGVAADRVEWVGLLPEGQHLRFFNRIDLLLDCTPYNGAITTQEGLWMGVPTVSCMGPTYTSRVGLSILSRVGLEIFAAKDPDEFVAKAVAFAGQPEALAAIRGALRQRMLASALCDPRRMAGEVETAVRSLWRTWCHQHGKEPVS